jgi:hypothetical protein
MCAATRNTNNSSKIIADGLPKDRTNLIISFLNNYFIFKKVRQVSSAYVHNKYTQDENVKFVVGKPQKLNKNIKNGT